MIRITRGTMWRDVLRGYKIHIDGVYCGEIQIGDTKEFEVENGNHVVCAKLDWCRSNELCVEVNDSVVELEVGSSLKGWRFLFVSFYTSIWKDKYLFLREKETVDTSSEDAT